MPPQGVEIETPRLWLRRWRAEDLEPFAALNADAEVMEHFPSVLSREESAAAVGRVEEHFESRGFGFWAVEVPGRAPFIGFIGLAVPGFEAAFTHVLRSDGAWRVPGGDKAWLPKVRQRLWRTASNAWSYPRSFRSPFRVTLVRGG